MTPQDTLRIVVDGQAFDGLYEVTPDEIAVTYGVSTYRRRRRPDEDALEASRQMLFFLTDQHWSTAPSRVDDPPGQAPLASPPIAATGSGHAGPTDADARTPVDGDEPAGTTPAPRRRPADD